MADLAGFHRRLSIEGPRTGGERLLFALLVPLGRLYGRLMELREGLYRRGLLASYRAPVPVISVGNLAVGGTGKTPMVDWVVRHLLKRNLRVAVVSRGYGGSSKGAVTVVSEGKGPLVDSRLCGDEPFLLARRNPGAVVITAPRRAEGVRAAVQEHGAQVVVLDDGFQHLAVRRDSDLVLLDSRHPFGNGHTLPAGLLREFPSALQRAGLCILTRCEDLHQDGSEPDPRRLRSSHVLSDRALGLDGQEVPLASLSGLKGLAFAGIAHPEGFFSDLRRAGVTLARTLAFGDHVVYDAPQLERIREQARGMDYLITTEKDGVKLEASLFDIPCHQVPLSLIIDRPSVLEQALEALFKTKELQTMNLSEQLLEILACPKCKGPIRLEGDRTGIICDACRLRYPVRDEIPVMLIDEARSLED